MAPVEHVPFLRSLSARRWRAQIGAATPEEIRFLIECLHNLIASRVFLTARERSHILRNLHVFQTVAKLREESLARAALLKHGRVLLPSLSPVVALLQGR